MRLDYLMWWTRGMSLPPLASASPAGVPRAEAGVLGSPSTTTLFGDERVNSGLLSGVRLNAGIWSDSGRSCGWEFDFFGLESSSDAIRVGSDGDPVLRDPSPMR